MWNHAFYILQDERETLYFTNASIYVQESSHTLCLQCQKRNQRIKINALSTRTPNDSLPVQQESQP